MTRLGITFAVVVVLTGSAHGHDFWLEPATFFPESDRSVAVQLLVGDGFNREDERAFEKKATPRLQLLSSARTVELLPLGQEGKTPFLRLTIKEEGQHWLALERSPRTIRLEPAKFNDYLTEEGLNDILDRRRVLGEHLKPGRERYSRSLKCLLQCGRSDEGWKKTCGHRLEIVPLADPLAVKIGGTLKVHLLFEGKPLAKAPLFALCRDGDKVEKQKLTTGEDGTAAVKMHRNGVWLVRMVHMRRSADTTETEWESFWTALTFGRR